MPWLLEANCANLLSRSSARLLSLSTSSWRSTNCPFSSVLTLCGLWHWRVSWSTFSFRILIRFDCSFNLERSSSFVSTSLSPPAEEQWSSSSDLWILSIVCGKKQQPRGEKAVGSWSENNYAGSDCIKVRINPCGICSVFVLKSNMQYAQHLNQINLKKIYRQCRSAKHLFTTEDEHELYQHLHYMVLKERCQPK